MSLKNYYSKLCADYSTDPRSPFPKAPVNLARDAFFECRYLDEGKQLHQHRLWRVSICTELVKNTRGER